MKNPIQEWGELPVTFIGVDTGYHLIKTKNHVFSNGVTKCEGKPPISTETIELNGSFFAIGGERLTVMEDKTKTDAYQFLTLAAITKEMQTRGLGDKARVVLGVGVPFKRFRKEQEALVNYLELLDQVEYHYEGKPFKIRIEKVYCFPQCYAAIADRVQNMQGRYVVADIGSWTKDVICLEDGKVDLNQTVTVPNSIITLYQEIRDAVMEETGTRIPESVIQNYICGKDATVPKEVATIMDRHMEKFASDTEGMLRENGFDPEYSQVIFIGGGATIMKKFGENKLNYRYLEDVRMNAKGYELLASHQWRKEHNVSAG